MVGKADIRNPLSLLALQFTHHMYSNIDHAYMRKYLDT